MTENPPLDPATETSATLPGWRRALDFALANPATVVFIVALIPRLVFLYELHANSPTFYAPEGGDEILYDRLASGAPEPYRAYFHSPLYIEFVKAFYALFGRSLTFLRFVQHVCGALSCSLIVVVAQRLFRSRPIALDSGLVAAVLGPIIFYEGQLCIDALMPPLVLLCAFVCLSLTKESNWTRWGVAGLLLGATALGRPVVLAWIPFLLLWALGRDRQVFARMAALLIGTGVVIAPITIHNIRAEGDFVLISANGGLNLYIGNNEIANGEYVLPYGLSFRKGDPADDFGGHHMAETEVGHKLTSAQTSAWWSQRAMKYIREQPAQVFKLILTKIELLANDGEITQLNDYYVYQEVAPVLRWLPMAAFVMAPGIAGMILLFAGGLRRNLTMRFAILVLLFGASFLPFFIVGRYRTPMLLLMTPFAAYWVSHTVSAWRVHRREAVIPITLLVVAIWATTREIPKPSVAYQYIDFAQASLAHGNRADAIRWCKRSIERDPLRMDPVALLARLLREDGDVEEAERVLRDAMARSPDDAAVRRELGRVLGVTGRDEDAIAMLRTSLDADPRSIATWRALADVLRRDGRDEEADAADRSIFRLLPLVKDDH